MSAPRVCTFGGNLVSWIVAQCLAEESRMQIKLASSIVDDQEKALRFYTNVLGFVKKTDITMGTFRWLTVSSPEGARGVELLL
ncbi:MAG TPA: VOC family protein, partial [Terriglobales bacterium]